MSKTFSPHLRVVSPVDSFFSFRADVGGHRAVTSQLLEAKADPNAVATSGAYKGESVLMIAAQKGRT